MIQHKTLTAAAIITAGMMLSTSAMAIPSLQLFIEGADYETSTENPIDDATWAKLGTTSFRLWVLGSAGEGAKPAIDATHRIRDVKFVASFLDGLNPGLDFSPTTTDRYGSGGDPSTPVTVTGPFGSPFPVVNGFDAENWSAPTGPMGAHGMLAAGRTAREWNLGNFERLDSPIGNTQPGVEVEATDNWFPTPAGSQRGQINVYDVLVSNLPDGAQVHFDVYGVLQELVTTYTLSCSVPGTEPNNGGHCSGGGNELIQTPTGTQWVDMMDGPHIKYDFAPFSHDARWQQVGVANSIPAPGTLVTFLAGLLGLGWMARFKRRSTAA